MARILVGRQPKPEQGSKSSVLGFQSAEPDKESRLVLAPVDGEVLEISKKLWLCALSRAENPGMGRDKDRRRVGNKWDTGPALVIGVKAMIKPSGDAM